MANFIDACVFTATAAGTVDFTVATFVQGYMTPARAGMVDGLVYRYRAENADLSLWEIGYGSYTASGSTLARTTVLYSSDGTTNKVAFTTPPRVAIVPLKIDFDSLTSPSSALPSVTLPLVEAGSGAIGSDTTHYALADHVHPAFGGGGGGGASVTISDTPPPSPTAGNLWWESDTGNLYIYYNDGNSSQWVLAVPAVNAAALNAVLYTAQTLTAPQQVQARANIDAAQSNVVSVSAVRYDSAQAMTTPQQTQARTNIDAAQSNVVVNSAVRYDVIQTLTTPQQAQARSNIGAISLTDVPSYVVRSYLAGLTLSTAGASPNFSVAAGVAADSTNAAMITLAAAMTKTTAAWTAGSGNGALDTGTILANTWYGIYLIRRPDTGVVDVLISGGVPNPTSLPASYTQYRRIGAVKTNGSSQWIKFSQFGDEFWWDTPVSETTSGSLVGGTALLFTLTTPLGVQTSAIITAEFGVAATTWVYISSPDTADLAAGLSCFTLIGSASFVNPTFNGQIRTDVSSRIRFRSDVNITSGLIVNTKGWIDRRGRDA